jgi:hypothetical protein
MSLSVQARYHLNLLNHLKTYPDFKKHKPVITMGNDVFSGYIDYHIHENDVFLGDLLFIETVMPLFNDVARQDYTAVILDPEAITSVSFDNYYTISPEDIILKDSQELDITALFTTLLQVAEYGCLHWGMPFRAYGIRFGNNTYVSGIEKITFAEQVMTIQSPYYLPSNYNPLQKGITSAFGYAEIKALYIPLINLREMGLDYGIYPDALQEHCHDILQQRNIFIRPAHYLTTRERRNKIMGPYPIGSLVYHEGTAQSYINIIDNNVDDPGVDKAPLPQTWLAIEYDKPEQRIVATEAPESDPLIPLEGFMDLFNR